MGCVSYVVNGKSLSLSHTYLSFQFVSEAFITSDDKSARVQWRYALLGVLLVLLLPVVGLGLFVYLTVRWLMLSNPSQPGSAFNFRVTDRDLAKYCLQFNCVAFKFNLNLY